jgi:hypothetical protein
MDKQKWNTHSCPCIQHDGIWGNGGIAPLSSQSQHKMGMSIQPHAAAALTPGKRPQYSLSRGHDGSYRWSGCVKQEKQFVPNWNQIMTLHLCSLKPSHHNN